MKIHRLNEIRRIANSNEFWDQGPGDYQNMIDYLLEHIDELEGNIARKNERSMTKPVGVRPCGDFHLRKLDELTQLLARIVPVPANCGNCIHYDEKGDCKHGAKHGQNMDQ